MLQAMRGGVKSPIMKVFLVFLAVGFALWGVGDITTGLIGGSDKAITAGDESLSPREVAIEFDRMRRNYMPNATMGEALQSGLLGELAGVLARDVVFKAETKELGLTITRAMQRDAVAEEQAFKDELGNFSQTRFISVLSNAGLTEEQYLAQVDTILGRRQIVDAIGAGAAQPSSTARILTAYEQERRTASLVSVAVDVSAIPAPDETSLSAWFETVKANYDAPALRSARVGAITPSMFAGDIEIDNDQIEDAYADRIDEFTTPETRDVRQMVFESIETANTAFSRVAAGEEFNEVAADLLEWSIDDVTLGTVGRGDFEDDVADAVFDGAAGEIVGPVESAFGFHVLIVDGVNEGGEVALEDVRESIIKTLQEEAAIDLIFAKVNILEDKIAAGASLDEAMLEVGGNVLNLTRIDRRGNNIDGEPVDGGENDLTQDSLVLDAIWTGDIDDLSVIQEGTDDMFFVVEVTEETDPRSRTLDEVKSTATADWQMVEAVKAARKAADAIAEGANAGDGSKFTDAVTTTDFRRNGSGLDHEAAGIIATAAFAQDTGEISVVETGSEAIAVRTEAVIPVLDDELDKVSELVQGVIVNSIRSDILNTLARDLSETHDLQIRLGAVQQLLVGSQN